MINNKFIKGIFWIIFLVSMSYGFYRFFYLGDYGDNLSRYREVGKEDVLKCTVVSSSNQHGWPYFITDNTDSLYFKPSQNYAYSDGFDMSLAMSLKKGDFLLKRANSDSLIVVKPIGKRLIYLLGKTIE